MNILILNWRDIKNPQSGGAEILTHEMAKRWVAQKHRVVQFSALYSGGIEHEFTDGVEVIRRGSATFSWNHIPVHLAAYVWYQKFRKNNFDIIIDEIHGIPFFSPLYTKEKIVALICEVANEIWDVAFSFPTNIIGHFVESEYFKWYKNIPFLTISTSTKMDLLKKGINPNSITVLPMGLSLPDKRRTFIKEKQYTLLFVARLTRAKGVEDALEVVHILKKKFPYIRLWIVGGGSDGYLRCLRPKIVTLELADTVKLLDFVSDEKKFELMSRAHVLIVPSLKEGWGLTVPEAGIVRTPAVGYDVAGLRDVIQNGKTGLLSQRSPEAMAAAVTRLLEDKALYELLSDGAYKLAKTYSWDNTANTALRVLEKVVS